MTLILTDPTGPITRFDGGTIMVRCADFVDDDSRGTIEVVTDADSVCGDVVHEEQLVPYDTSAGFGSPYAADYEFVDMAQADISLRIPIADLGFQRGIDYVCFIGVKMAGAGDVSHSGQDTFMEIGDQNTRIRGYNDVIDEDAYVSISPALPRPETNAGYRLKWFQYVEWVTQVPVDVPYHGFDAGLLLDDPPVDLVIVAAAGEDSTYEFYLDAIYFVPTEDPNFRILTPADPTGWDPLEDVYNGDPWPTSATDDNVATNALDRDLSGDAQYSVIYAECDGFGTNWEAPGGDLQGEKSEPSFYSIMNFESWAGPEPDVPDDPLSWIPITVSRIHIPAQTVEAEDFATDVADPDLTSWTFASDSGEYYWRVLNDNAFIWDVLVDSGSLQFRNLHCSTVQRDNLAILGDTGAPIPVVGTPSHSVLRGDLTDMHAAIFEANVAIDEDADDGVMNAFVGFWQGSWPAHQSSQPTRTTAGVCLYLDGGDLKATLRIRARTAAFIFPADENFGTSPVTIDAGYSLGDLVRVKVERKYYVWRAKVWMDGDTEPSSWTLEGFLPNIYSDTLFSPTTFIVSDYPYSDDVRDDWGNKCRSHTHWFPCLGGLMEIFNDPTTSIGDLRFEEATLSYDPGGATPVSSFIALEKYDGSVDFGEAEFETDRIVIASLEQHTFEGDTEGFDVYLWNDTGAPDLQVTCATDFIMRVPGFTILGLYYKVKV